MPDNPPTTEDQISEHVPWEHLTIPPSPDRKKLIYGLAAGLVVVVLGVVIVRQLDRPSPEDLTTAVPVTTTATTVESAPDEQAGTVVQGEATRPAVTVALAEPEAPQQLSEADLVAMEPGSIHLEMAARAEWYVLEFFTLDPSEPWRDRVEAASGLELPADLAPETPDSPAVSYVEWIRTQAVLQTGENTYQASVLIRRLVAPDSTTFSRLPTERVNVLLHLDPDGRIRIASLPEITTPETGDLIPLDEVDPLWVEDEAGIGWPSSRKLVTGGHPGSGR